MSQQHHVQYLQNGMVHNFINQILKKIDIVQPTQVIVAWDAGRSWRKTAHPEYKANRVSSSDSDWFNQLNTARDTLRQTVLPALGIDQYIAIGYEADDIAGNIAFVKRHNPTVLYSNDKDWLILVDDNTSVLYKDSGLSQHVLVTWDNFYEVTGWRTPEEFLLAKCAIGDKSDNIVGLRGIGPITVKQYFNGETKGKKGTALKEFYAGSDHFRLNLKLMDIRSAVIEQPIQVFPGRFNQETVLSLFHEMQFNSLLSRKGNWLPNLERLTDGF